MKKAIPFTRSAVLTIALLGLLGQGAAQAALVCETEAEFCKHTQPGFYLEEFDGLTPRLSYNTPMPFKGGSLGFIYEYSIGADNGFYAVDQTSGNSGHPANPALAANDPVLLVTIARDNVTAVGGQFFLTDQNGNFAGGDVIVNLSDGTSYTNASSFGQFLGFTTSPQGPAITSLKVRGSNPGLFVGMDHFYAGAAAAVSEPTTLNGAVLPQGSSGPKSE
jgi:hypothetical protein